jgi:ribonuclease R
MQKLDSAREFVTALACRCERQRDPAQQINHLLALSKKLPYSHLISEVILRTQAQAVYSPENIGHFDLRFKIRAFYVPYPAVCGSSGASITDQSL